MNSTAPRTLTRKSWPFCGSTLEERDKAETPDVDELIDVAEAAHSLEDAEPFQDWLP